MKHLKLFEEREIEYGDDVVKAKYSSHINWKMINDAKDMSLEYLDENLSLIIRIHNSNDHIANFAYSHIEYRIIWFDAPIKDVRLCYSFDFIPNRIISDFDQKTGNFKLDILNKLKLAKNEFISRIHDAYPKENIVVSYSV